MISLRPHSKRNEEESITFLGKGVVFEGTIHSSGSVRIDGRVKGTIERVETLVVSEEGYVESNINGDEIILDGEVHGNVNASGKVEVHKNGRVIGNIDSPMMMVQRGGRLFGKCNIAGNVLF